MLRRIAKSLLTRYAIQVERSMADPEGTQELTFDRLGSTMRGSDIAARSGFEECRRLEDCRNLPAFSSTSMKPIWDEVFELGKAGNGRIGRTRLVGFARTSGTCGRPKDVPLNSAYLGALDRSLARMIACRYYTTGEWDSILSGTRVLLGSRPLVGKSPTGLPICDISGLIPTRTPKYLRHLYSPAHRDLWIQDWPEKAEVILDQLGNARVLSIVGIPPLAMDFSKRACARFGVTCLDQIWPDLSSFVYGGEHLSDRDKSNIRSAWLHRDRTLHFIESYFATEGQLAFTFDPGVDGLALNTLENLYLFRVDGVDGPFRFAHELEKGAAYSVHVTTPGGLVNYEMGDRIEVVEERPLLIRVTGRDADEISMAGERLTVEQIDLALAEAGILESGLEGRLPVVWVGGDEKPHLVWGVPDHLVPADREQRSALAARLDGALGRFNVHYEEALVWEKLVDPARVESIPRRVFDEHRERSLGIAQAKARRLFRSEGEFRNAYSSTPPGEDRSSS